MIMLSTGRYNVAITKEILDWMYRAHAETRGGPIFGKRSENAITILWDAFDEEQALRWRDKFLKESIVYLGEWEYLPEGETRSIGDGLYLNANLSRGQPGPYCILSLDKTGVHVFTVASPQ